MPDQPKPVPANPHITVLRDRVSLGDLLAAAKRPTPQPVVKPVETHVPPESPAA